MAAYSFLSVNDCRLDAKNRLSVPVAYRSQLAQNGDNELVLRLDDNYDCLNIYPKSIWNEELAAIQAKLNMHDKKDRFFFMSYARTVRILEMDNNGRILIPKYYMQQVGLDNEVQVTGLSKYFSIAAKNFGEELMTREELADEIQRRLGNKD
jgi:MraZ protein